MKKPILIAGIVGLLLVIGGVALFAFGGNKNDGSSNSHSKHTGHDFAAVNACDVFTEAEAKAIIGDDATTGNNTDDIKTDDVNVSTCSYRNNATDVQDIRIITIMVRSALTETGGDSNMAVFGDGMPKGSEQVDGYGDDAYYTPSLGQLNILDGHNWISITSGGTNAANSTLEDAKAVARYVIE